MVVEVLHRFGIAAGRMSCVSGFEMGYNTGYYIGHRSLHNLTGVWIGLEV